MAKLHYTGKDGLICGHRWVGVKIRMTGGLAAVGLNPAFGERGIYVSLFNYRQVRCE
jgi:hypothetical protein